MFYKNIKRITGNMFAFDHVSTSDAPFSVNMRRRCIWARRRPLVV